MSSRSWQWGTAVGRKTWPELRKIKNLNTVSVKACYAHGMNTDSLTSAAIYIFNDLFRKQELGNTYKPTQHIEQPDGCKALLIIYSYDSNNLKKCCYKQTLRTLSVLAFLLSIARLQSTSLQKQSKCWPVSLCCLIYEHIQTLQTYHLGNCQLACTSPKNQITSKA